MSSTLRTTINSQILTSVTEQSSQINDLKLHFTNLNSFVSKAIQDINKSNINSQILTSVTEQNSQISEIKNNLTSLNNTVSKLNTDITNSIIVKFLDIKKDYIDDVKNIISMNSNEKTEKLTCLIEKNNSHLIDKTTLILNDIIINVSFTTQPNTQVMHIFSF
jgi:protoheme ferro-lyase